MCKPVFFATGLRTRAGPGDAGRGLTAPRRRRLARQRPRPLTRRLPRGRRLTASAASPHPPLARAHRCPQPRPVQSASARGPSNRTCGKPSSRRRNSPFFSVFRTFALQTQQPLRPTGPSHPTGQPHGVRLAYGSQLAFRHPLTVARATNLATPTRRPLRVRTSAKLVQLSDPHGPNAIRRLIRTTSARSDDAANRTALN